tara:strand:- start:147 stop:485 length:339 start_codon:yes stop_codon:yes gene_type:complete
MISIEDLESWVEKFDSEAEIYLLLDLLNNKIKIECMLDSIVAYAQQDYENAKYFHKEMYRKDQKPNDLDLQIEIAEQELEVAKENLNQIQQHLFLLKAERDQQKERKNVNKL